MNMKFLVISLVLLIVLFAFPSSKGVSTQSLGPGKMTYVTATIAGGPQTVDPALGYDTASGELIANVYDPLVFFKTTGSQVVPWLADSFSISPDGLTYTFHIRPNVQWHDPAYGFVTPADAEYSLERIMVRDYLGGPAWMFWYPIFGQFKANLTDPVAQGTAIDNAITSNATHVTVQFQTGKAYLAFLGILAQTWGSIMCRQWAIDHDDWNPATQRLDDGGWIAAHDPATSPLDTPAYIMMGSGPFRFNYFSPAVSWSILRNVNFWGGWDTTRMSLLGFSGVVSRGHVNEIVEYFIADFAVRLAGFTASTPIYDSIAVPRSQMSTVWQKSGIRLQYPLATQVVDAMFFAFDVGLTSPYIGTPTGYGYFGENGITPDFFSDVHARKAVAYSLDWPQYIGTAYLGEAQQVGIPLPAAGYEPYYNGSPALKYGLNVTRAVEEWKLAWGGQVWANGFRLPIAYNEGNVPRQTHANMLKTALEAQNPKFHVDVVPTPWSPWYPWHDGPGGRSVLPIYIVGWMIDYPDPDDWVPPFIESTGTFSYPQHIEMDLYSPLMDRLIEWGRHNTTVDGRNANYQQLWKLYHDRATSVPLENAFGRRVARDWVHGWYFNPIFPGVFGYPLWKEDIHCSSGTFGGRNANWEDVDEDGKVDVKDLATAAKAFGAYFIQPLLPPNPQGPPGYHTPSWNSKVDVNAVSVWNGSAWTIAFHGDMKIDIKDLATIAKMYGFVGDPWTPEL